MTLEVQVVSPERVLWSGEAEMVTARVVDAGDIAFLTGHVPYLGALDVGQLLIRPDQGDDVTFVVHGGFVEVSDDKVSVLSDHAEPTADIDVARARAALEQAEIAARDLPEDPETVRALKSAQVRLAAVEGD